MERIAVVGSNSFTGSHIVAAFLAEGHDVLGISRSPEYKDIYLPYKKQDVSRFTFHQRDILRQPNETIRSLDDFAPGVVVNVAALSQVALSHERPVEYFRTNTVANVNLVDHLRRQEYLDRYVHISSAEVYGSCDEPVEEDAPYRPSTPYAASKAAMDMYLRTLRQNFGTPVTIIRSTNVYGPHQQLFKIIPRTVIYNKMGRTLELHGGGTAKKSFVHIRDVVRGLIKSVHHGLEGVVHFTDPSEDTIADVVRQVCKLMGRDFGEATEVVGERLGQDDRYWLDCSKAERQLGWAPEIPFRDGLEEVIQWVESNWETIRNEPLEYQHKP